MSIEEVRETIDAIDLEIVGLLNRRARLSREIALLKRDRQLPVVDQFREREVLRRVAQLNAGTMQTESVANIYRTVLRESRRIQIATWAEITAPEEVCQ